MRASILIWIVCLARYFSRDGFALNSLSASAIVILSYNPAQLFQTGFHLSFLAVIALFWLAPKLVPERKTDPLSKLIDKSRPGWERSLRSIGRKSLYWWAASLSIWCLTLPIAANGFHLVSPIGLVLNVFLWFPVMVALFSGFGTLFFSWLPPVGALMGWVCSTSFVCLEAVVKWAQSVPGSYQWVAGPTDLTVAFFYLALSLVLFSTLMRRHSVAWMCAVACLSFVFNFSQTWSSVTELRCTFLSVGHGSCVVVELPDGQVWLYDAGSIGGSSFAVNAASQYLWRRRIGRLDAVIVSHADVDHFNGVPELLNRFHVHQVVSAPHMFEVDEPAVELLENTIAASGIGLRTIFDGAELTVSGEAGLRASVLHPPVSGVEGSDNANSIVLSIEYAGKNILLTGDVEFAGLDRLIEAHRIDADVAMAPHHGSPRSEPERFLEWCSPEVVVISSGQQHDVSSACRLYESSNRAQAYHTARDGAVSIVVDAVGISIESIRDIR